MPGAAFFRLLIDKVPDDSDSDPRFVILIDELRHLHQRSGYPLREHQEGKQRADVDRIAGRKREIDAERESAADRQSLQRPHAGLNKVGHHAFGEPELGHPRHQHIPEVTLTRIERQRLDRARPEQRLRQKSSPFGFRGFHGGHPFPVSRQHHEQPDHDQRADTDDNGCQRRTKEDHHRNEEQKGGRIRIVPNNWPTRKVRIRKPDSCHTRSCRPEFAQRNPSASS